MCLNESLNNAYDTIREAACFDSHSLVPHPENLKFQASEERRAMYKMGTMLVEIVGNPDGEDLHYAAQAVRRHFWKELGLSQPPEQATEVPRFLLKPEHRVDPRTDPQELASQLAAVPMLETPVLCIVSSKLALLQKLLNLPDVAIKFLTLAYVNSSRYSLTKDDSSGLPLTLVLFTDYNCPYCKQFKAEVLDSWKSAVPVSVGNTRSPKPGAQHARSSYLLLHFGLLRHRQGSPTGYQVSASRCWIATTGQCANTGCDSFSTTLLQASPIALLMSCAMAGGSSTWIRPAFASAVPTLADTPTPARC